MTNEKAIEAVQDVIDWCIDHPDEFMDGERQRVLDELNHVEGTISTSNERA